MKALRNKEIGWYQYRGYYFHKPEGCTKWNVHKIDEDGIDFCFMEMICNSFSECT